MFVSLATSGTRKNGDPNGEKSRLAENFHPGLPNGMAYARCYLLIVIILNQTAAAANFGAGQDSGFGPEGVPSHLSLLQLCTAASVRHGSSQSA
eukprot:s1299_g5.t1